MIKRFGALIALDDVAMRVPAGSFHTLLGENGAGKSTLVKCLVGYYQPDTGRSSSDNASGPSARPLTRTLSASAWSGAPAAGAFMPPCPSRSRSTSQSRGWPPARSRRSILKQLYLQRRFMIPDEPTSVLTPAEADEVLGMLKAMARGRAVTILMITHKFREVMAFADAVSVLRRGRLAGEGRVAELDPAKLAELMVGTREIPEAHVRRNGRGGGEAAPRLAIEDLVVEDDTGLPAVDHVRLAVRPGEIVGMAGVSGNGQRELVEALIGQRPTLAGTIRVGGKPYRASRREIRFHRAFSLPEEPLRSACVPAMSVAENMALRNFDRAPLAIGPWLRHRAMVGQAERWIAEFKVKTQGPDAPIATLSGGNGQRAVLARELSEPVSVLIAANPVFGLDFAAVAEIHDRILAAREAGAAVLLVSEDLDDLLELSDRIVVMFDDRIVHETPTASADTATIGRWTAGHGGPAATAH